MTQKFVWPSNSFIVGPIHTGTVCTVYYTVGWNFF
jgi:hypothetical protein